jgi:hypothetical protein
MAQERNLSIHLTIRPSTYNVNSDNARNAQKGGGLTARTQQQQH